PADRVNPAGLRNPRRPFKIPSHCSTPGPEARAAAPRTGDCRGSRLLRGRMPMATFRCPSRGAAVVVLLCLTTVRGGRAPGHTDFKRRDVATRDLAEAGEAAYPALVRAAKHTDPEVARRAEELLAKLRQAMPAERLEVREHDVVHTADSKNAGKLKAATLKVKTLQFGEQQLKLADIRTL